MITDPACYGKLPVLGDYFQHNAPHREVAVWWNRFTGMRERFGFSATGRLMPWCFTLPPGIFSWSGKRYVLGVITLSEDRIGRNYPFVVWQKASLKDLQCPRLFGPESHARNWLFWLAQLVAAHTTFSPESTLPPKPRDFERRLEQLWHLHKPDWRVRFGLTSAPPSEALSRNVIGPLVPLEAEGVHFMPWADWPRRLWAERAPCCFWRQDQQGRYLQVFLEKTLDIAVLGLLLRKEGSLLL